MDTLVGVFRTVLPARYWHDVRNGAYLSILLTAALGVRIGYAGFFERAQKAGQEGAALALKLGAPGAAGGVGGLSQTEAVGAALMGNALTPLAFFLFTPLGWLADYLVISAGVRGITLAVDNPWGDPLLTMIDNLVRGKRAERVARKQAVPDALSQFHVNTAAYGAGCVTTGGTRVIWLCSPGTSSPFKPVAAVGTASGRMPCVHRSSTAFTAGSPHASTNTTSSR